MNATNLKLVLYNLRSIYNVGSILRTADAAGVHEVIAVGTTPYPETKNDSRPPHIRDTNTKAIAKVALGAETSLSISYLSTIDEAISFMRNDGLQLLALEQSPKAVNLFDFKTTSPRSYALIVGPEVTGIEDTVLDQCDAILEIPMYGTKESLNVSVATGITLYKILT